MPGIVEIFVGLLMAVVVLVLLARRLNIAYPILLVLGGLLLGFVPGLPSVALDPEFIFLFVLPPLLFPAALFTPWRDFRSNLRPILLLAIGLVLFTTAAVGWAVHSFTDLPLAVAFALGAIISPPDAIAATAIAERLSIPRRIIVILEGESLVNDATALVAYSFAVAAVVTGSFSLAQAGVRFVEVAAGGIGLGLVVGQVAVWFHRRVDDAPVEVTFSLLTPYVAYLLAEQFHVSGVLAVVTAGLFLGWRLPEITSSGTRLQAGPFWDMLEFLLNGFVFILIGLQLPGIMRRLPRHALGEFTSDALLICLLVIGIRILWVFPATYLPRFFFKQIRARDQYPAWQHVLIVAWTGMRGVVSLAAALALPLTFPGRDLVLFFTFAVILATLVVQGLTLPWLIRGLGIKDDMASEREETQARLEANRAALAHLLKVAEPDPTKADALQRLRVDYEDRIRQLESYNPGDVDARQRLFSTEFENLSTEALKVEREVILRLRNREVINDAVLRRIQHDIDLAEARLRR